MAFREYSNLDISTDRCHALQEHEFCINWFFVYPEMWKKADRSIGRLFQMVPNRKIAFMSVCRVKKIWWIDNLNWAFVTIQAKYIKVIIFKNRADLVWANNECLVREVMES